LKDGNWRVTAAFTASAMTFNVVPSCQDGATIFWSAKEEFHGLAVDNLRHCGAEWVM
jgi:hypothetical protein